MTSDKELKANLKKRLETEYKTFFPVKKLEELGFSRLKCTNCHRAFWSTKQREVCGDSECEGRYSFIGKKRENVDFIEVWRRFEKLFKKQGYTSIKRYPTVARWNPSMHFTLASIADFQPYVVSGEVEPPAEKLVVPQTCIRFNDTDNVGITGGHLTGFTMIGQHAFLPKDKFNQEELFQDYYNWYIQGMKLKPEEFVIHEDAWAGGGNFGPCLEFFSGGVEIGNQVYMMFESAPSGPKELKQKVLDMGMGQERCAWFLSGSPTLYDVTFPTVMKYLLSKLNIKQDKELISKFVHLAGTLNIDEIDDVDKQWTEVAKTLGVDTNTLKENVLPLAAAYSIADHTRTLLYALSDGALPSNVGGGYNLRVLFRRIQSFIEKYDWELNLDKVIELHAHYLKPQYPELSSQIDLVKEILAVEKRKHDENKKRNTQLISKLVRTSKAPQIESKLLELYDSQGILPEEIQKQAKKQGIDIKLPERFYAKISEKHEKDEQSKYKTKKEQLYNLDEVAETGILYYTKWDLVAFNGFVEKIVDGNKVALNETAFYPTSGGQMHDIGEMNGIKVIQVFKQGNVVLHELESKPNFKKGDKVVCKIDLQRRYQLAQHHTAAHILNGASRRVLGEHIWQAGAAKTPEKARLDITHYDNLTEKQVNEIEDLANKVVKDNRPVISTFVSRNIAEKEYGFRLYQGGAVPGKRLRIVNIDGFDVEACGGTHLSVTGDIKQIKIIRTTKIQDGVIRIEFVAGNAATLHDQTKGKQESEVAKILECNPDQIPGRAKELFGHWKQATKAHKKKKPIQKECFTLTSQETFSGDVLEEAAKILKTQKHFVLNTVLKFKKQLEELKP
ncbi:MAG: alanine--tRNA ligase [Nanoarchaeota archaeon]|nr:alanine--tRNA ligase [Nanoarchaeota archaeon]